MMSQILLSYTFLIIFNATFFVFVTSIPYVAQSLKVDELNLAYSQTFFNILLLISTTFIGNLLNRLDYKMSMALCFGSVALASIILVNSTSMWMIILAQCLGIFMAAQQCVQLAIANLTKPGSERTNAFSKLGICFGLGFMLTPIISKIASMFERERASLEASALISLVTLPLVLIFIDNLKKIDGSEKTESEEVKNVKSLSGLSLLRKDGFLRLLFGIKVLLMSPALIVFGSMQIYLMNRFQVTQTTNTLTQLNVGISMMFSNSVGISFLRARYTEKQLIWIGAFICIASYAQLCFFYYLFQIWFILFFLILGITIAGTSADSLISNCASQEQQGLILGLSNSAISVARTSAPTFGIWLTKSFGFGSLGVLGIFTSLIAIFFIYSNKSFENEKKEE